jgi:hypothetical protein
MANTGGSCADFSVMFKELFSLAAYALANQIHQPLEKLGILFEEPLETGRQPRRARLPNLKRSSDSEANSVDLEKSTLPSFLSAGKFLFVIRQVNKVDVAQFAAAGFRFAPMAQILNELSRTMELPNDELAARLDQMQAQTMCQSSMPHGVHLACFMLRPRLRQGFDILVPAKTHNELPTVRLPYDELLHWEVEVLEKLDNWTLAQIIEWLEANTGLGSKIEKDFRRDFLRALTQIVRNIEDPSLLQAKFSARIVEAPSREEAPADTVPKRCFLLSIHMISTIHALSPKSDFDFIPLRSFTVQQQVYMGVVDQEAFARQAFLEFAHCFESQDDDDGRSSRHSSRAAIMATRAADSLVDSRWRRGSLARSEDESRVSSTIPEKLANPPSPAIIVSNHVTVNISDTLEPMAKEIGGHDDMGTTGHASTAAVETETFVDKLFAICRG